MGQLFRLEESRLPRHYRDKNIHFIVMGEKQEITTGGDWTTTISGQMLVFPTPMSKREAQKTKYKPKRLDFYKAADHQTKFDGRSAGSIGGHGRF